MVYVLLADGFEESEAIVPIDLLRRADCPVTLVGLESLCVVGAHGITITADCTLDQVATDNMELLLLPGGMGGVEGIQMNLFAMALIQKACDLGCYVAAICAAPILLAALGVLDRRKAVCHPDLADEMGSAVLQPGTPVVVHGRFITGEAAGAAFPFALKLVEVLKGSEAAQRVASAIYYHD